MSQIPDSRLTPHALVFTMADKIKLRVVTPSRLVLEEEVDEVSAPGELGEFGVLPNHISFLSTLVAGEMSYKQGAARHSLVIGGGYAEVLDNVMTVLAPAAEFPAEIDTARAQRAKERAEKRMGELNFEDPEYGQLEEAQRRALARLQVASKETRR
jgi:F-type H+-transporting ATPase subunit epsilon